MATLPIPVQSSIPGGTGDTKVFFRSMGWRGYIGHDSKAVFFWSQKAACTTLFSFLADNMDDRPERKNYFHTASQPYRKCIEAIQERGYRSIIVARHPVNRAISAYFNKFCLYRGQRLLSRNDLEPFAQDLHDLYCERTGAPREANSMSFEDYLETVAQLHRSRETPTSPVNGHWDTQVPPFYKDLKLRYDTIVHVENLDDEMGALARALGLHYRPRMMNRTEITDMPVQRYLGHLPAPSVSALPFGSANFITPQTIDRIREIYAVDFKVLRYRPDARRWWHKCGLGGLAQKVAPKVASLTER